MNNLDRYLQLTKIELVHYFGKSDGEADKMINTSKYFQSPACFPLHAEPSTWAILLLNEKKTNV